MSYNENAYQAPNIGFVGTEDAEDEPYWEQDGWVPLLKSGKQRSPNMIRNELQKFIDQSDMTQTAILKKMRVNNNSFRRFMDPSTYKDQWSATQNSTYWAAARLLEAERNKPKKRKAKDSAGKPGETVSKKSKGLAADELIMAILATEVPTGLPVYDSCPQLVKKIKDFLARDGMTKSKFCQALGGLNSNSLNSFLSAKKQDGAGNRTYPAAFIFFEKLRIYEGKAKSKQRLQNETEHPMGFELEKPRKHRWFITPRSVVDF